MLKSEPQNWLTYWGDYGAQRYRALKQINTANVKDLRLEWMFQTGQAGAFETVPLVVDGIMYFTAAERFRLRRRRAQRPPTLAVQVPAWRKASSSAAEP